jgi:hypothetical protein
LLDNKNNKKVIISDCGEVDFDKFSDKALHKLLNEEKNYMFFWNNFFTKISQYLNPDNNDIQILIITSKKDNCKILF